MLLSLISDTHEGHAALSIPSCDLLVHTGDWSRFGTKEEAESFFQWLAVQPAREKVVLAGNHDWIAEQEPEQVRAMARDARAHLLCNEAIDVLGLSLWGSPLTPEHGKWAFQKSRGAASQAVWEKIPAGLDLLLTHGPPHGV